MRQRYAAAGAAPAAPWACALLPEQSGSSSQPFALNRRPSHCRWCSWWSLRTCQALACRPTRATLTSTGVHAAQWPTLQHRRTHGPASARCLKRRLHRGRCCRAAAACLLRSEHADCSCQAMASAPAWQPASAAPASGLLGCHWGCSHWAPRYPTPHRTTCNPLDMQGCAGRSGLVPSGRQHQAGGGSQPREVSGGGGVVQRLVEWGWGALGCACIAPGGLLACRHLDPNLPVCLPACQPACVVRPVVPCPSLSRLARRPGLQVHP